MAKTYILDSVNSDLSGGADFSKALVTSGAASGSVSVAVATSATETSYGFTPSGFPGNGGTSTGSFSVELNVTSGANAARYSASLTRVNSAGVAQATSSAATETTSGSSGIYTFNFTDPALGTWAEGDRLRVNYIFRDSGAMGVSVTIGLGTTDSEVVTPFNDPTAAGSGDDQMFLMFF